ncbi:hypothetical protein BaRGS_00035654 [Batillaria attramentaria]|uniref:Anti-proliferative protein domain-containing protein n=1 Tax=Batillaria attramentaria TaxID=370345 RepID=A0ABD0JE59_9CAEN
MRDEIAAAVLFIGRVVGEADGAGVTSQDKVHEFTSSLSKILEKRFQGHWHTDKPSKGQGYRSIRIHPAEPLDPVLERAALASGLNQDTLYIPVELTLWVDPQEVCCRFGDLKATYCTVLTCRSGNLDNKVSSLDIRDLLDTAKAQYSRQQHIRVVRNSPPPGHRPQTPSNGSHYSYGMPMFGSPSNGLHMFGYVEGFLPDTNMYNRNGEDGGHNGFMNGFHIHHPPPVSSQYQPSFTATAVNTTPRKTGKGGSAGHFRKGNGSGGRGGKPNQQQGGESGSFSHNHNNNLNTNGSTTSSGSNGRSSADRYHWVRNGKGQQQQQQQQQQSSVTKESK